MIEIVMLVATLVLPDGPPTRVVAADWPYFKTFAQCQQAAQSMQKIPRAVETVICERRILDVATGRIVEAQASSPQPPVQPRVPEQMILKIRFGTRRTRLVEVIRRDESGGGFGWRVDYEGKRFPYGEQITFAAKHVVCEIDTQAGDRAGSVRRELKK